MVNDTIPVQEQSSLKIFPDPPYGTACCVACDRSTLRSMADTPSVVTPCRLASGTLLKARETVQPMAHMLNKNLMVDLDIQLKNTKIYSNG